MLGPTASSSNAAVLRPDQIVGAKYRVERLLAQGGMAAVWAGTNIHTHKQVALKVMLPIFATMGEAMEMFRREALAASRVNHPNVVNIFDVIEHDGMTCIVMELLEGETLGTYLARRGALSLDETVALLLPAMRGVAAANECGVIHRDLKPGNLFLCKDGESRVLTTKVLDFGISMSAERSIDGTVHRHGVGAEESDVRFGTPAYMAPEDIESPQAVDRRADVYGFGVLLFEALTGKVPFPGPPGPELFAEILDRPPPSIGSFRPDLPLKLQLIVDRALAKKPAERFPDVDNLVHAIEEHLLPADSEGRVLSPTLTLGTSAGDESHDIPLATVTSVGDSGPNRIELGRRHGWHALLERRTLAAGLLVAMLLVSPWIALRGRGKNTADSPLPMHAATAPIVTQLPAVPRTETEPVVAPEAPPSVPVQEPTPRKRQIGHRTAAPTIKATSKATSARGTSPARAMADRRRALQSHLPVSPRAGKLSASDF